MAPIHVVGIGLEGAESLTGIARQQVQQASLLVGSARHLGYFSDHAAERLVVSDFVEAIAQIRQYLLAPPVTSQPVVVILTSGDPLFFGLGRLLLEEFPPEQLTFHPHTSSVQLAFSRVKLPWQDARVISAHGRSLDELMSALQQGANKIAVLTDRIRSPEAIAQLLEALSLTTGYRMWVCENLGGADERVVQIVNLNTLDHQTFAALNVVILEKMPQDATPLALDTLPLIGIADEDFLSFPDRPGLMTKREIRTLILAELALQPGQIIWDIGAGTGSVAIEIARNCSTSKIYAIEKTAIGLTLIQKNCQRFHVNNIVAIHGSAPSGLADLPAPDRIFIGGSGGTLTQILDACSAQIKPTTRLVMAIATLEHLTEALAWFTTQNQQCEHEKTGRWHYHLLQVQISRSVPIAALTRFSPLNPVTLITAEKG